MTEIDKDIPSQGWWLVYTSMVISAVILLGEAFGLALTEKWTAKIGIALLFTAFALLVGNGRKSGYIATGILWVVIIGFYAWWLFR